MIIVRLFYISDPLLDFHSFRQTQTAITAYYLAQNDLSLSSLLFYETPVLGYPWQIPMEFPLYQYIGALIFKVLNIFADTKLDLVLRLESILLFFGTSFFLFKLTRITTSREVAVWTLILYLISPFSIEWSRDAMIEPLANFLGLAFILIFIKSLEKNNTKILLQLMTTGTLLCLTKITTAVPCYFFCFCYLLFSKNADFSKNFSKHWFFYLILSLACIIPLFLEFLYVHWTDTIKENTLGFFLTSRELNEWNFGTVTQRFTLSNWIQIFSRFYTHWPNQLLLFAFFFNVCFGLKINPVYWKTFLISTGSVLVAITVFFNLYFVHTYYYFAVFPFECIALAICMTNILAILKNSKSAIKRILLAITASFLFLISTGDYFNTITTETYFNRNITASDSFSTHILKVSKVISENSSPDESVIIIGYDWSSAIPYYSERKALMIPDLLVSKQNPITKNLKTQFANVTFRILVIRTSYFQRSEWNKILLSISDHYQLKVLEELQGTIVIKLEDKRTTNLSENT